MASMSFSLSKWTDMQVHTGLENPVSLHSWLGSHIFLELNKEEALALIEIIQQKGDEIKKAIEEQ